MGKTLEVQSKRDATVKLEVSMVSEQLPRPKMTIAKLPPQADKLTDGQTEMQSHKQGGGCEIDCWEVAAASDTELEEWEENLDVLLADLDAKLAQNKPPKKRSSATTEYMHRSS